MKNMYISVISLTILFSVLQTHAAWTSTEEAANQLGAAQVQEVGYDKNSSSLSEVQKNDVRSIVAKALQAGRLDEIKILSWSDKEYPSKDLKQNNEDIKLAKMRMSGIKQFLKDDLKISSVKMYNMTERPNAIQKFFNTKQAAVKNTTEFAGAAPVNGNTGLFDFKSQASKSIVMVFLKK